MGRNRKSGSMSYDLTVSQDAYNALLKLAEDKETSPEEVLREQLLNDPESKGRLVPKARRLLRHATIRIEVE